MAVLPIIKVIMLIAFMHGNTPVWEDKFLTTLHNCSQIVKKANHFNAVHPGADKVVAYCDFHKSQTV